MTSDRCSAEALFPITPPPFPLSPSGGKSQSPSTIISLTDWYHLHRSFCYTSRRTYSSCQCDTRSCPATSHLSHSRLLTAFGAPCLELLSPRLQKSLYINFTLTHYVKMEGSWHIADLHSLCVSSVIYHLLILSIRILLAGRYWQQIYTQVYYNFIWLT